MQNDEENKIVISNNATNNNSIEDFSKKHIEKVDTDYDTSRDNLKSLIDKSMLAIDRMEELLQEIDDPQKLLSFFECVKTTADLNEKLVKLNSTYEKIERIKQGLRTVQKDNNKSTIKMSPSDLIKLLEQTGNRGDRLRDNLVDITPTEKDTVPKTIVKRDDLIK